MNVLLILLLTTIPDPPAPPKPAGPAVDVPNSEVPKPPPVVAPKPQEEPTFTLDVPGGGKVVVVGVPLGTRDRPNYTGAIDALVVALSSVVAMREREYADLAAVRDARAKQAAAPPPAPAEKGKDAGKKAGGKKP